MLNMFQDVILHFLFFLLILEVKTCGACLDGKIQSVV